jgi:protein arginine N-methyltransferase 1
LKSDDRKLSDTGMIDAEMHGLSITPSDDASSSASSAPHSGKGAKGDSFAAHAKRGAARTEEPRSHGAVKGGPLSGKCDIASGPEFTYTRPKGGRFADYTTRPADPKEEKSSADYYFDSYAHFGIHEEMLKDHVRTDTYRRAIVKNPELFRDKIVLDIGAGTGILCMFAAQAGAKHVYGIECAGIATHAKKIVAENGFADKITILHGKAEEITLPVEKVDVIISEWMGYFLIYESMLDTVLYARDKWLKPDGVMMPDKGRMYLMAIEDEDYKAEKFDFWDDVYGFKMSSLKEDALREPLVDLCPREAVATDTHCILDIDLYTVTKEELDFSSSFRLRVRRNDEVHALAAYFDCWFSKSHTRCCLTTAPWAESTHWKQTVFYLDEPIRVFKDSYIVGSISAKRNEKNPRDIDIMLESSYLNPRARDSGALTQARLYSLH